MELRRLNLFLAVVEHGGFTRAAKAVFISQPALSQGVKELESELGVELFHRLGRKVELTPAGRALVGPARQAVRDVEAGRAAVQAVTDLQAGRLDLCSLPTLAADPLAPLVGAFRRAFPGVSVVLASPRDSADLARMVREGICEVGLTEGGEAAAPLVARSLTRQQWKAVLPPGAEKPPDPMSLKQLLRYPLVSTPRGTSTRDTLDEALARLGLEAEIAVETSQRDAMLPLVMAGAGAAILPGALADEAGSRGAQVASLGPKMVREVVLTHRTAPLSPAAAAFVEAALGAADPQDQGPKIDESISETAE